MVIETGISPWSPAKRPEIRPRITRRAIVSTLLDDRRLHLRLRRIPKEARLVATNGSGPCAGFPDDSSGLRGVGQGEEGDE